MHTHKQVSDAIKARFAKANKVNMSLSNSIMDKSWLDTTTTASPTRH